MSEESLFQKLGGRVTLERVHKVFYDKLYDHLWFKSFFGHIDQRHIENQQTDFMTSNMGGGPIYFGKLPKNAHKHIYITDEMFGLRQALLKESLDECDVPKELAESWLKIDNAFRASLVKSDSSQCQKRFFTDELVIVLKPPSL